MQKPIGQLQAVAATSNNFDHAAARQTKILQSSAYIVMKHVQLNAFICSKLLQLIRFPYWWIKCSLCIVDVIDMSLFMGAIHEC